MFYPLANCREASSRFLFGREGETGKTEAFDTE